MSYKKISSVLVVLISATFLLGSARGAENLERHFSDAAREVKATDVPSQKREILDQAFSKVTNALTVAESIPLTSKTDREAINRYKAAVQNNQDELNGANGYRRIADGQLDAFSNYVVQDMEQADQMITISLVTLLLIIILVFLIAR